MFVTRPFFRRDLKEISNPEVAAENEQEHLRSSLLAERDRILNALQELEFDYVLGKVPEEDYPEQRTVLLQDGAQVLRQLDGIQVEEISEPGSVEDRIEAAVAARRADASVQVGAHTAVAVGDGNGNKPAALKDPLEDLIASRKRQREEKSAGFCPGCGKPAQKSDRFCSRCGATL
jgi:hypothetical protein